MIMGEQLAHDVTNLKINTFITLSFLDGFSPNVHQYISLIFLLLLKPTYYQGDLPPGGASQIYSCTHAWPSNFQTPPKRVFLCVQNTPLNKFFAGFIYTFWPINESFAGFICTFWPLNKLLPEYDPYQSFKSTLFSENLCFWYPLRVHARPAPKTEKYPFQRVFLVTHVCSNIFDWPPREKCQDFSSL